MKCQDFEKILIMLARHQLMEEAIREQSLAHADICGRCRTRLRDEQTLLSGITAVVAEIGSEGAPSRVETALQAAFRAQTQATASPGIIPMTNGHRHWKSWKLAAVAAGIIILISVMAIFWRSSSTFEPPREESALSPNPAAPPVGPEQVAVQQAENRPQRLRHARPLNRTQEVELVTRFFPLREGEDLTALESLQVVRVELTSSALGEFGLLVEAETTNEPVKADVLVGQDGLARAIRFVHLAQVR
jgi:hypothetical protein